MAGPATEKAKPMPSIQRYVRFLRPWIIPQSPELRLLGVLTFICTVLQKLLSLAPSYATKVLVDALVAPPDEMSDAGRLRMAVVASIAFFVTRQSAAGLDIFRNVWYERIIQTVARQFSTKTFEKIHLQSFAYHLESSAGVNSAILGRGTAAVTTLLGLFCMTLGPTIIEAAVVITAFYKVGAPEIALTTAVTAFIYICYTGYASKRRIILSREKNEVENKLSKHTTETLSQVETVKMFAAERREVKKDDDLRAACQDQSNRNKWFDLFISSTQNFIQVCGITVGMLLAASNASSGLNSPGDFMLATQLIAQLFGPLNLLGNSYNNVVTQLAKLEEVMDIFDAKVSVEDEPGAKPLHKDVDAIAQGTFGEIEFDNVSFTYEDVKTGSSGGVSGVSFRVPPGTSTALVGASGSGKSTCIRLLLRLWDTDAGEVRINGSSVKRFTQQSVRECVGIVAQDTILFDDTVRYNIAYGCPNADDGQIWSAIRASALEPYVQRQMLGLDTVTGPRGVQLSGGERQRVGAARCILKNPGIILLDEATSALDGATERVIQKNLEDMCRNRTTISVAHRLSTIVKADQILVFEAGQIIERGTHQELIQIRNGKYASMWHLQGGSEADSTIKA